MLERSEPFRRSSSVNDSNPRVAIALYAEWVVAGAVLSVYLLLAPTVFRSSSLPFDSDEAVHAVDGLRFAARLANGRFWEAVSGLYLQRWYPPFLTMVLAPFLLVCGPQLWAVRYPSLLAFLLGIALLYRSAKGLWLNKAAALGAVLLAATSPFWWVHAVLCMEEVFALVGFLVVLLVYARVVRRGRGWLWVGIAAAAYFLVRTTSGLFMLGALTVVGLTHRHCWRERFALLKCVGPGILTVLLWWGPPAKLTGLVDYFAASAPQFSEYTAATVLNYPRQLLTMSTVGVGVGAVTIAGLLLSLRQWQEPRIALLLTIVFAVWTALLAKRQVASRFFSAALAPAYLLGVSQIVQIWRSTWVRWAWASWRCWLRRGMLIAAWGYVVAALVVRILAWPLTAAVALETSEGSAQAFEWAAQQVGPWVEQVLLVNGWDNLSAPALEWTLWKMRWGTRPLIPVRVTALDLEDPEECAECVPEFLAWVRERDRFAIVHLANTPVPSAGAWWAYAAVLSPCWDGIWKATSTFFTPVWAAGLLEEILAHPMEFAGSRGWRLADQMHYALSVEVSVAHWERCANAR